MKKLPKLLLIIAGAALFLVTGCATEHGSVDRVRTRGAGQEVTGSVLGVEVGVQRDSRTGDVDLDLQGEKP